MAWYRLRFQQFWTLMYTGKPLEIVKICQLFHRSTYYASIITMWFLDIGESYKKVCWPVYRHLDVMHGISHIILFLKCLRSNKGK